jgi:hypothetical protein
MSHQHKNPLPDVNDPSLLDLKHTMIDEAKYFHPDIRPCLHKDSLMDCFTTSTIKGEHRLYLWFNIGNNNTRVEHKVICKELV